MKKILIVEDDSHLNTGIVMALQGGSLTLDSAFTTSSAFMPTTREEMPLVLPLQPPVNFTSFIMPSSMVTSIWREHTPFGLYTDVFVICFSFPLFSLKFSYIFYQKTLKKTIA